MQAFSPVAAALAIAATHAAAAPTVRAAPLPIAERDLVGRPYAAQVRQAAQRFGMPPLWISAVIRVESNGDPRAVSSAGALGLMQLMPATWAMMRARYGLGADPFAPRDNIQAGAAYLREMYDRYGDPVAMLAAYNAGPGRYDDYRGHGRPLPDETIAYLARLQPAVAGGRANRQTTAEAQDAPAWTRAALFIARTDSHSASSGGGPAVIAAPTASSFASASMTVMASANTALPDLFIPLSGRRRR